MQLSHIGAFIYGLYEIHTNRVKNFTEMFDWHQINVLISC